MKRVLVLVEGQTEESFVRDVLAPHLEPWQIYPTATIIRTGRRASGKPFKGGVIGFTQFERQIRNLLGDRDATVTTMIDYYRLPEDFPGHGEASGSGYQNVDRISHALKEHFSSVERFRPYLSLHELEALIFADLTSLQESFPEVSRKLSTEPGLSGRSPEEINDGDDTHPAARLEKLVPGYRKALHGPQLLQASDLETIRRRCPNFNAWLTWLESLGSPSQNPPPKDPT